MYNAKILKAYNDAPKNWISKLLLFFLVITLLLFSGNSITDPKITSGGLDVAKSIIRGLLNPSWDLFGLTPTGIPYLLLETICIAFLGTLIGAILALPTAFLSASNMVPQGVSWIGRFITMVIRTIPAFVYGLMFIRVSGPGPFAGLLTMSLTSVGMLTKLYVETIEDLDFGILESMSAMGCTGFHKVRHGVIPQLMPDFISTVIYRFDMNLRDATTLGLVGAGGIGASLIFAMNEFRWNDVGAYLLGLITLVFIIEYFSGKIRVKLTRG